MPKEILPGIEKTVFHSPLCLRKPVMVENKKLEISTALQTPEKTCEPPLLSKHRDGVVELLDKYKIAIELFDSMCCSMRLLALCKKLTVFSNICAQVEVFTKRKFSYKCLAQLKYILPEAIQTDKILLRDEKTLCMKSHLNITLLLDVIEGHNEHSDFLALHQVFASRLKDFITRHPKGADIPEAELPELYNKRNQTTTWEEINFIPKPAPEQVILESLVKFPPISVETQLTADPAHLHSTFTRYFSSKIITENEKTQLLSSEIPLFPEKLHYQTSTCEVKEYSAVSIAKHHIKKDEPKESPLTYRESTVVNSSALEIHPLHYIDDGSRESPLRKLPSSADSVMIETPAQLTPKRSTVSCKDKFKTNIDCQRTSCYMPAKRSLDFLTDHSTLEYVSDQSEDQKVAHGITCNTERQIASEYENAYSYQSVVHQVEGSLGWIDGDFNKSRSSIVHERTSTCLPNLVHLIYSIFQSVNFSSITKEEVVHKLIMNDMNVTNREEIEKQIQMLEKLVPEWICSKQALSGDILYTVDKVLDLGKVKDQLILP